MDAKNKLMESDTDLSTAEELANQVFRCSDHTFMTTIKDMKGFPLVPRAIYPYSLFFCFYVDPAKCLEAGAILLNCFLNQFFNNGISKRFFVVFRNTFNKGNNTWLIYPFNYFFNIGEVSVCIFSPDGCLSEWRFFYQ